MLWITINKKFSKDTADYCSASEGLPRDDGPSLLFRRVVYIKTKQIVSASPLQQS